MVTGLSWFCMKTENHPFCLLMNPTLLLACWSHIWNLIWFPQSSPPMSCGVREVVSVAPGYAATCRIVSFIVKTPCIFILFSNIWCLWILTSSWVLWHKSTCFCFVWFPAWTFFSAGANIFIFFALLRQLLPDHLLSILRSFVDILALVSHGYWWCLGLSVTLSCVEGKWVN